MTPTRDNRERGREEPPQQMAQGPPPQYPSGDYSYVLEIVMRMQDTMGLIIGAAGLIAWLVNTYIATHPVK